MPPEQKFRMYLMAALSKLCIDRSIREYCVSSDNKEFSFVIEADGEDLNVTLYYEEPSGACRISCTKALPLDAVITIGKIQEAIGGCYQKLSCAEANEPSHTVKSADAILNDPMKICLGCFTAEKMDLNVRMLSAGGFLIEIKPTVI